MSKLPLRIDLVSDVVCPWCVIGYLRLQRALADYREQFETSLHWHPFELNPQMPAEGQNLREHLAEKYGTTPQQSIDARQRLTDLGADLGFTFDYSDDMRMYNTFDAHQLLHWAHPYEKQTELSLRLFEDFFGQRKDVSNRDVLADAAQAVGLNRDEALQVLEAQAYAQEVRAQEQQIMAQGVQGVPLFIFNREYGISGAQEVETFKQQLQQIIDEQDAG
ncbi:DsbA family oxidoreductase [Microbulbifer flavimaris]|uniref:DsbA family oxidoreductase n=1 Tax=Microbulbifer flavimaris TaxID=1781068 RepID=A0ABX4HZV0_9GAMM|nr:MULTISPECIES: DsbA family oxidoreductase [Microbulbifer]KUJ83489.1 disulfide bond formation protein DsbA [Microbulbifer sp. ZGT114]PCO05649.1 DsbA family oxidoreductase [Microbulbifer flavimaris]